ncbi:carbamoyl-phosphate synthase large subunit [Nanchangia anserum]|uniref:Carbamoyl phosphate synthase large chain n=1 Tax=Nanchangia anserum TaxID=2692125 RepID=A0A8I0G6P1_9ACTO|nr:carbamoyl-phosphate synthase large subunit [Nanchangia anserum]
MPKRTDISSVLVIGSGPIVIGQACEFDYSGSQACRVLKSEGIRVILVNSNPATIMTDPDLADATYIEPLTPQTVERIIAKERPDALLPTLGGQTALNIAIALSESGALERWGVELIGASADAITAGEDREAFKRIVEKCGAEVARSRIAHSLEDCHEAAAELGYPLVVRPSFTMGGQGSGIAYTPADLDRIAGEGIHDSITSEVLLEEAIIGWKEYELEIMRDRADNVVVVCSIENIDPVGVHTGDSITVAPALTLTDRELQRLRDIGIAVIREVGVDTGGCNIQFAVEPSSGRVIVIEMNPRVSRSSALASKATGFPIAKLAARLALGYTLDEIPNDITHSTPASFEPALDYIVVKAPRFAFEKFPQADPRLTTSMKSVGEAMAIGRNFTEALCKALGSLDKPAAQLHWRGEVPDEAEVAELLKRAAVPTEYRLVDVQQALRGGASVEQVYEATRIDPWFLDQICLLNDLASEIADAEALDADLLRRAKRLGFLDDQIAEIRGISADAVAEVRRAFGLHPVYKCVDTCAGEFAADTPYHYSTYDIETEVRERSRPAIIILGSGPNRIGQGIEFDYSCVHATQELRADYDTIMVNCNPETVSTDYDISTRLYFEPLTFEHVMEIYRAESRAGEVSGVLVQLGGQTPLALAARLEAAGVRILGTPPAAIAAAEDRELFGAVLDAAGLASPAHATALSPSEALEKAEQVGYPILVRPSFVLGGRGMEIIDNRAGLADYVERHQWGSAMNGPLLIDRFLDDAIEIDVDALYDGHELFMGGVMEHIEACGIHSGDSACVLPPMSLSVKILHEIREATEAIARGVGVRGLVNIQFALAGNRLVIIEANPRASRTVPFVSKAQGWTLARAAARIMTGTTIAELKARGMLPELDAVEGEEPDTVAVKEAVLPFSRFLTRAGRAVDTVLGPEMRSTGEVMGLARAFPEAFSKSQVGAGSALPHGGVAFVSVADRDKRGLALPVSRLVELGFTIVATSGTARILRRAGIAVTVVAKASEAGETEGETIVDLIESRAVDLVVNTTDSSSTRRDGYVLRAAAVASAIPLVQTMAELQASVQAIEAQARGDFEVYPIQSVPMRERTA